MVIAALGETSSTLCTTVSLFSQHFRWLRLSHFLLESKILTQDGGAFASQAELLSPIALTECSQRSMPTLPLMLLLASHFFHVLLCLLLLASAAKDL